MWLLHAELTKKTLLLTAGSQITDDGQNLNFDSVIDRLTFRNVDQSMVANQKSDLTFESHAKWHQVHFDPTEIINTEKLIDTPSTFNASDLQDKNNTRGGKYNLLPIVNPFV